MLIHLNRTHQPYNNCYLCIVFFNHHVKMLRDCLVLVFMVCCLSVNAQRRIVVLDVETHEPVAKAAIVPYPHPRTQTDSTGMAILPEQFDSLLVSHIRYDVEHLRFDEVRDTVYLFAKENMIDEVTVVSQHESLKEYLKRNRPLPNPSEPAMKIGVDKILKFFKYKSRREKKRERTKRLLEEYDAK